MAERSLMSCLKATKSEIIETLSSFVDQKGKLWWYKRGDEGQGVTLVAHIDTVWDGGGTKWVYNEKTRVSDEVPVPEARRRIYFDRKEGVIWSPDGLGADDRAGVFSLLYIWDKMPEGKRPNLLFTDLEEKGGQGARDACKELKEELAKANVFIELDRKNLVDAVFYNSEPKEFIAYVCSFGYKEATGSFSDISIIGREMEICSVNLSCGYYDQHTKAEHLYVTDLFGSLRKAIPMIQKFQEDGKRWGLPQKSFREYKGSRKYDKYDNRWSGWGHTTHHPQCLCDMCLIPRGFHGDARDWQKGYEEGALDDGFSEAQRELFAQGKKEASVVNGASRTLDHHPRCRCRLCLSEKKQKKSDKGNGKGKSAIASSDWQHHKWCGCEHCDAEYGDRVVRYEGVNGEAIILTDSGLIIRQYKKPELLKDADADENKVRTEERAAIAAEGTSVVAASSPVPPPPNRTFRVYRDGKWWTK
jgi:hypothetical protein